MKKCILGILCSSTFLLAQEGFFIGAEAGSLRYNIQVKANNSSAVTDTSDNGGSLGGRIGYQTNDFRIYAKYIKGNAENNLDISMYSFSADYFFNVFPAKETRLYLGASYGVFSYEESNLKSVGYSQDTVTIDVAAPGLNIGILHNINQNLFFELGAQAFFGSKKESLSLGSNTVTAEVDNPTTVFAALNYTF